MAHFRFDGQRIAYTIYGEGPRTTVLLPGPAAVAEDAGAAGPASWPPAATG